MDRIGTAITLIACAGCAYLLFARASDRRKLSRLTRELRGSTNQLRDAVAAPGVPTLATEENSVSASTDTIAALTAEVARTKGVVNSAVVALNGRSQLIADAVAAAIANGATEEQLAPVTQALADLKASDDALAAAIVLNPVPAPPGT